MAWEKKDPTTVQRLDPFFIQREKNIAIIKHLSSYLNLIFYQSNCNMSFLDSTEQLSRAT